MSIDLMTPLLDPTAFRASRAPEAYNPRRATTSHNPREQGAPIMNCHKQFRLGSVVIILIVLAAGIIRGGYQGPQWVEVTDIMSLGQRTRINLNSCLQRRTTLAVRWLHAYSPSQICRLNSQGVYVCPEAPATIVVAETDRFNRIVFSAMDSPSIRADATGIESATGWYIGFEEPLDNNLSPTKRFLFGAPRDVTDALYRACPNLRPN